MQTITLLAGQTSQIFEVGPGTRITSSGNGYIQWVAGSLSDAKNGSGTWATWAKGTAAGYQDTTRRMCIRAVATGSMTVTIDESKQDSENDGIYWDSEIAWLNEVSLYGASPSASASVNTAAIQSALSKGGLVTLSAPGTYLINDTLVYGSNTHLKLAPGVVIKQAPNTNKTLLVSDALARYQAGGTTVTPTWTSGTAVSIAWTAHGLTAGDACYLWGVTPLVFVGVFKVDSVTDANTIVIRLPYTPTGAATGTMKAIVATQNAAIEGGLWDYDFSNNSIASALNVHGISIYFAENCHIKKGTKVSNCNKYAFVSSGTLNCTIDAEVPYNNSDGVKVYGPARNTHVLGVVGTCNDDVLSLQAYENLSQYFAYVASAGGELYNVTAKNINSVTAAAASIATLYLTDGIATEHIEIDGVSGFGTYAAVRIGGLTPSLSVAGQIKISNVTGQGVTNRGIIVNDATIRSLTIDRWKLNPNTTGAINSILLNTNATIDQVIISNPDVTAAGWQSAGGSPAILLNGVFKSVIVDKPLMNSVQLYQGSLISIGNGTTNNLTIQNGTFKAGLSIVTTSGTLGAVPTIAFRNNYISGPYRLVGAGTNCNILLSGNYINNAQQGIVRTEGAYTVSVSSDGTNQFLGTTVSATTGIYTIASGTPVISVKGWDIPQVINATGMTKTNGSYCYNTAAAAGTIVQNRLVTCNGTNWVQVDTPANVF